MGIGAGGHDGNWAGVVTGEETVNPEDTMVAVAYDGHLATYADEVAQRVLAMWSAEQQRAPDGPGRPRPAAPSR